MNVESSSWFVLFWSGAEGRTCLTGSAERGHRGAVRERAAHGNDGVVCAGSRSRIGTEKARASQLGLLVPKAGLVRSEATE